MEPTITQGGTTTTTSYEYNDAGIRAGRRGAEGHGGTGWGGFEAMQRAFEPLFERLEAMVGALEHVLRGFRPMFKAFQHVLRACKQMFKV